MGQIMGQIIVRQLDDRLIQLLRERAAAHGHSMEQEVRAILAEVLAADRQANIERLRRRQTSYGERIFSDSAELVRRVREDRAADWVDRR